jgi:predicted glycosyltransferase
LARKTADFLNCLHSVLKESDEEQYWHIYLEQTHRHSARFAALFAELPGCRVEAPSKRYLHSLLHSQKAIIYGGYNSLMDVLSLSLPALVILRDMRDNEQQEHLDRLLECSADTLTTLTEECSNDQLAVGLRNLAMLHQPSPIALNLDGAKEAAQYLGKLL